jgi:outer membrane protein assembly factor BamB
LVLDPESKLSELDGQSGRIVRRFALAPRLEAPSPSIVPGHYLAASGDGQTVFALVRLSESLSEVVAVDRRTLTAKWRRALSPSAGRPRAIVIGPISGTVFALTDFEVKPGAGAVFALARPVVSKLDATTGTLLTTATLRDPDPLGRVEDWQILQGLIDPNERTLLVSYHNQGLFTYDLTGQGFQSSCLGGACLPAHGDIALWEGAIVVATGSRLLKVLAPDGSLKRSFDTGLERNHLMTFALDSPSRRVYVVGSCHYVPAMVTVDLDGGERRVVAPESAASKPCGERLLVSRGKVFVVGPNVAAFTAESGAFLYTSGLTALDLLA